MNGYNGLFGLVQNTLEADPTSGVLFLFVGESRKLCKAGLRCDGPLHLPEATAVALRSEREVARLAQPGLAQPRPVERLTDGVVASTVWRARHVPMRIKKIGEIN